MSDLITPEILDILKKNIPAHLSDTLQKELAAGAEAKKNLNVAQAHLEVRHRDVQKLETVVARHGDCEKREKLVKEKEDAWVIVQQKMAVDTAVLENSKKHTEERLKDMKELVLAVFSNNRFKYTTTENENSTVGHVTPPCPGQSYNNINTTADSKSKTTTVEGEGSQQ